MAATSSKEAMGCGWDRMAAMAAKNKYQSTSSFPSRRIVPKTRSATLQNFLFLLSVTLIEVKKF
jgi:hypothetical protein